MSYPSQTAMKTVLLRLVEELGGQIELRVDGSRLRQILTDFYELSDEERNRKGDPNT